MGRQTNAAVLLPSPVGSASRSAVLGSRISSIGKSARNRERKTDTIPSASELATTSSPVWAASSKPRNATCT